MDIEDDQLRLIELKNLDIKVNNTFNGIIAYIRNKETDCEAISAEIERLQALKKARANKAEYLRGYIKTFMEMNNIKKQEFPTFSLTVAKNPPGVEITNEGLIPDKYKKEEIIIKLDKIAIKADIQAGVAVEGAELTQKTSLRIK